MKLKHKQLDDKIRPLKRGPPKLKGRSTTLDNKQNIETDGIIDNRGRT